MTKTQLTQLCLGGVLIATTGAGYLFKAQLAVTAYFPAEKFRITNIEKRGDVVVVTQELPFEQLTRNPLHYRDCPFSDNKLWAYQDSDHVLIEFEHDGILIKATKCPNDWSILKSGAVLLAP